jgi:hypothetical protein
MQVNGEIVPTVESSQNVRRIVIETSDLGGIVDHGRCQHTVRPIISSRNDRLALNQASHNCEKPDFRKMEDGNYMFVHLWPARPECFPSDCAILAEIPNQPFTKSSLPINAFVRFFQKQRILHAILRIPILSLQFILI